MSHNWNRFRGGVCFLLAIFAVAGGASANQLFFFSGDLRTDATVLSCGVGCTLGPGNTDGDYAQWAAAVYPFNVCQGVDARLRQLRGRLSAAVIDSDGGVVTSLRCAAKAKVLRDAISVP